METPKIKSPQQLNSQKLCLKKTNENQTISLKNDGNNTKATCGCTLRNKLSYFATDYGTKLKDIIYNYSKK